MTIIEAIKSGRAFRRAIKMSSNDYIRLDNIYPCLAREDIIATDWELEPPKPVVYETKILDTTTPLGRIGFLARNSDSDLNPFIGKKVRVTVEPIEGE